MQYQEIMWAERTVDVYSGDNCDEHKPLWRTTATGDRGESEDSDNIILNPSTFPAGTKITIKVPCCPKCHCDADMCDCVFDWKNWAEEQYS